MGSLIPNMWFWITPTTRSRDMAHAHCQILPLKWPIYIAFIHYSAMDQARSIKVGIKYG